MVPAGYEISGNWPAATPPLREMLMITALAPPLAVRLPAVTGATRAEGGLLKTKFKVVPPLLPRVSEDMGMVSTPATSIPSVAPSASAKEPPPVDRGEIHYSSAF